MAYLLDTNVLVRLANIHDALYPTAVRSTAELHRRGESPHVTPQNLIEYRNVATRAIVLNGLGLSTAETERKAADFESAFVLLPETPDIYPAWKTLVSVAGVIGKQVHDARLVAVCHVHGISQILTFNSAHFARLAAFPPGVVVVDPRNV